MLFHMPRRSFIADGLGDRIKRLRLERGWTQVQLAEQAGCSKRAIIYYEKDGTCPPAPVLAAMAKAFGIDLEKLVGPVELGKKPSPDEPDLLNNPEDRRLWKKLQQIKTLPERDKVAVIRLINSLTTGASSANH
jgi:transcriptional regulator with XRE-family HTH domain